MARGERCVLWDKVALGGYNANIITVIEITQYTINGRGPRKGGRAKR